MTEPVPPGPGHEGPIAAVEGWFRKDGPAIADDAKALLQGHSAALLRAAADILEAGWPGGEPVASKVLEVALGVAKAAGIVL